MSNEDWAFDLMNAVPNHRSILLADPSIDEDLWQRSNVSGVTIGCQFRQQPSSEQPGFFRQTATLVVGEAKPPIAKLFAKDSIFLLQIIDRVLLPLIHPSGNGNQ
jgi:hypothetical protein